jgi:MFS family permease
MAVTAVAPTVPAAFAGLAGVGLAWSLLLTSVIAVLQSADPRMLGRVMSLFALVLLGSTSAGGPIASSVAASIGPRAPFVLGAGAAVAAIVITSANRPSRPWSSRRGSAGTGSLKTTSAMASPRPARAPYWDRWSDGQPGICARSQGIGDRFKSPLGHITFCVDLRFRSLRCNEAR